MYNKILWTLDNEVDGRTFERLCVDLLHRNGYQDIVPVEGPQDHGRDAEYISQTGVDPQGKVTFFQFSLQKTWRSKLRGELKKVNAYDHKISSYVFVTSQRVRGIEKDQLKEEALKEYGWKLEIYSREWLRLQLSEAHPDLAQKYLGISAISTLQHESIICLDKLGLKGVERVWSLFDLGQFERASAELKDYLDKNPNSVQAWEALAWSQYQCFHYEEALASINHALDINPTRTKGQNIRGCILAEYGISEGNRSSLREAYKIFKKLSTSGRECSWTIYYNLGNTLTALGNHQKAIKKYKKALEIEPEDARIWKNLGSTYHYLGDHDAEMTCLDRALEINPEEPHALVSKGISYIIDNNRPLSAINYISRAIAVDPDLPIRWPHVWYWLSEANRREGNLEKAFQTTEEGLRHIPGHPAIKKLHSDLLISLGKDNPDYRQKAISFFKQELVDQPLNFSNRIHLANLYQVDENYESVWKILDNAFLSLDMKSSASLKDSGFSIDECKKGLRYLPLYKQFRKNCPLNEYWNHDDPLYDLSCKPPENEEFKTRLLTFSSIPFGHGYCVYEKYSEEKNSKQRIDLNKVFDKIRTGLEISISKAAQSLAQNVSISESHDVQAETFTDILMFVGYVSLREFGRQRGWITGHLQISNKVLDNVMNSYDETLIELEVITKSLEEINQVLDLFPKDNS